jgi:hypothetical protein
MICGQLLEKNFAFTCQNQISSNKKAKPPLKATRLFISDTLHTVSLNRCYSLVSKSSEFCE